MVSQVLQRREWQCRVGIQRSKFRITGEGGRAPTGERPLSPGSFRKEEPARTAGATRTEGPDWISIRPLIWGETRIGTWSLPTPKKECFTASCWACPCGHWSYSCFSFAARPSYKGSSPFPLSLARYISLFIAIGPAEPRILSSSRWVKWKFLWKVIPVPGGIDDGSKFSFPKLQNWYKGNARE